MRVSEDVGGRPVKKLRKVALSGQPWELWNEICSQLATYPYHIFNAVNQSSAYKKCKSNLTSTQAVCVVDFAENYVCRQFAEAQSAYYSRNAVTIHPMVLVFASETDVHRDSVVIISSSTCHNGAAVRSFMQILGVHLEIHYPEVDTIFVWSDGASSQYKSRVPMFNIANSFGMSQSIIWNFFGSRHGKGESDGESAVVKTFLDNAIKAEQLTIHNAKDAFELLRNSDRHILDGKSRRHFYYVDASDIADANKCVPPITKMCAVPKVRAVHYAKGGHGKLTYQPVSCYCSDECWHSEFYSAKEFTYPGLYFIVNHV
jgi:hypothetical protein